MSKDWLALKENIEHYLCPPGDGVYTVSTGQQRKLKLQQTLYGKSTQIHELWRHSLDFLPDINTAVILGICSDCGGGILRGANWGPLYLRTTLQQHYQQLAAFDLGDVRVIPHLLHDKYINGTTLANCRKALYGNPRHPLPVSPLSIAEHVTHDFYDLFPNKSIFAIGGDHSVSYPLVKSYLQAKQNQGKRAAIIHFDAHTDLLVERLGIDLCFGSWCTHILPYLNAANHLIQIGIRASGRPKSHWEQTFGVKQYWAEEVKTMGPSQVASAILQHLKQEQITELYVSFDIDCIDAELVPATGTPEPNGLLPNEVMPILEQLLQNYQLTGADMMEIAPFVSTQESSATGAQSTLQIAANISALLITAMNDSPAKPLV